MTSTRLETVKDVIYICFCIYATVVLPSLTGPVFYIVKVITLLYILYHVLNKDILPGPIGLPYFGILPFLKSQGLHLQLHEISKKHGDMFSFKYAGTLFINLGSEKALREVHVSRSDCFSTRPAPYNIIQVLMKGGITCANNEEWEHLRKFFLQSLKDYGMKKHRSDLFQSSLSDVVDYIKSVKGNPIEIGEFLTKKYVGPLPDILFGRNGISREDLQDIIGGLKFIFRNIGQQQLMLYGASGRILCSCIPKYRRIIKSNNILLNILLDVVLDIDCNFHGFEPTCVVESYLKEQVENNEASKYLSYTALIASLSQIMSDGILTVTDFIEFILETLVEHPEVQEKIYEEVSQTLEKDDMFPTLKHKNRMPYTNAVIYETERMSNLTSVFPCLECTKSTTLRGYKVPKGAITLLNAWSAHRNPETYHNPDSFDPSRYIRTRGKERAELPVSFGVGERSCIGKSFVRMQVFLFIATVIKYFHLTRPTDVTAESAPKICFKLREN